jgi:hypothetical protein
VDFSILGMGLPAVYLASRLSAEGFSVGLFGKIPTLVSEPASESLVNEFGLKEFTTNLLKVFATFDEKFELKEKPIRGFVVDTGRVHENYLQKAVEYGCEVLEGSSISISGEIGISWRKKKSRIQADHVVLEEAEGRQASVVLASRVPINEDTIEYYPASETWVLPAGKQALIGGKLWFTWSKFDRAAIVRSFDLTVGSPQGILVDEVIRLGRAAGQTTPEGFVLSSLYDARLLSDVLISGKDLRVYGKKAMHSSLLSWLE